MKTGPAPANECRPVGFRGNLASQHHHKTLNRLHVCLMLGRYFVVALLGQSPIAS